MKRRLLRLMMRKEAVEGADEKDTVEGGVEQYIWEVTLIYLVRHG